MAFQDVFPWSAVFLFLDNNGKTGSCGVFFPATMDYAEASAAAAALAADLQAISDASLQSYHLARSVIQDAPIVPGQSSEVERKLRIPMGSALRPNLSSIEVPSPVFSIELPGTDVVDASNALVVALREQLALGALGPGNGITDNRGEDITRVGVPVIVHRTRKPNK